MRADASGTWSIVAERSQQLQTPPISSKPGAHQPARPCTSPPGQPAVIIQASKLACARPRQPAGGRDGRPLAAHHHACNLRGRGWQVRRGRHRTHGCHYSAAAQMQLQLQCSHLGLATQVMMGDVRRPSSAGGRWQRECTGFTGGDTGGFVRALARTHGPVHFRKAACCLSAKLATEHRMQCCAASASCRQRAPSRSRGHATAKLAPSKHSTYPCKPQLSARAAARCPCTTLGSHLGS